MRRDLNLKSNKEDNKKIYKSTNYIKQTTLPLKENSIYDLEDFIVSSSNKEAYDALHRNLLGVGPYENILIIKGPASSGKTFLSNIAADYRGGFFISNTEELTRENIRTAIVDDADKKEESELFHIINTANEYSKELIIFTNSQMNIKLADLSSRFSAINTKYLYQPDDDLFEIFVLSLLSKKEINAKKELINYLKPRLPRNFLKIKEFIEQLDKFCLENKKNLSVKSASALLSE